MAAGRCHCVCVSQSVLYDMYWSVEVEAETKSLMLMRNKKFLHEAKNCLPSKTLAKYSVQTVCRAVQPRLRNG